MIANLPVLIVILPLCSALLSPLISRFWKDGGKYVIIFAIAASAVCSVAVLREVLINGPVNYHMGNWQPPIGIEFAIDPLNALIASLISVVSLFVAIYSTPFLKSETWLQKGGFYALYALLTTGLLGMVLTGDLFNLYVFLEISSLAGYGLIALGGNKSTLAAFRYLLIGTIGASFYLLGIGYLYGMTGTLNMADMTERLIPIINNPSVVLAAGLFVTGFGIKMALFPLHGWQPDSYTHAHPAAVPLIAGVMGKVPAYALLRMFFYIFGAGSVVSQNAMLIVEVLGGAAIIMGSVMALSQRDFRRMLAYSSVAQIGYIAVGMAIGNTYAIIGAVLHIISHAFTKGGLFVCVGVIQYKYGVTSIDKLGRLYKTMPATAIAIFVASLSMIGIPPMGGFFSKWYIFMGVMDARHYVFLVVLIISSLLNAIYYFRIIEKIFSGEPIKEIDRCPGRRELPMQMIVTVILFAIAVIAVGIGNGIIVNEVIRSGLPEVFLR